MLIAFCFNILNLFNIKFTNTHQNEQWIIYNKGEIELNQKHPPKPLITGLKVGHFCLYFDKLS